MGHHRADGDVLLEARGVDAEPCRLLDDAGAQGLVERLADVGYDDGDVGPVQSTIRITILRLPQT